MTLIWAARGRTWGVRFLRDGGFPDPLPVYDEAFSRVADEPEAWRREAGTVALRFPDPERRRDASGRVIVHELVATGPEAASIHSLVDGVSALWPQVAEEFARVWELPAPPSSGSGA